MLTPYECLYIQKERAKGGALLYSAEWNEFLFIYNFQYN